MKQLLFYAFLIWFPIIGFSQDSLQRKKKGLFTYALSGFVFDGSYYRTDVSGDLTSDYSFLLKSKTRTMVTINFAEFEMLYKDIIGISAAFDFTSRYVDKEGIRKGIQEQTPDMKVSIPESNYDMGIVPFNDKLSLFSIKLALVGNIKFGRFAFHPFFSPMIPISKSMISLYANAENPVNMVEFKRNYFFEERTKLALKTGFDLRFFVVRDVLSVAFRIGYAYYKASGYAKTVDEFKDGTEIVSNSATFQRNINNLYIGGNFSIVFGNGKWR
ncbi:hypothetical protein [Fluviicola sp.]|uniref:hypothetical protein n=1 Tax=Fluviicola sp. TaxID=1917219 RepID=UPI00260F2008|nr:hypothetical protein [Fluviicola sp.]